MNRYVFDTGALIAAERGKARVLRFLSLVEIGSARVYTPLPVVAEWWRGRSDVRDALLAATEIVSSVPVMKSAGVALASLGRVSPSLTIDAVVIATAAALDAVLVTQDPTDFERLQAHFPGVAILSV